MKSSESADSMRDLSETQPLTEQELILLGHFLERGFQGKKPMNLTEAHGLLCAITAAPTLILPEVWQNSWLGPDIRFEDFAETKQIMSIVIRWYNQITCEIPIEQNFHFILWEDQKLSTLENCKDETIADWCRGYLIGVNLDMIWPKAKDQKGLLLPFTFLLDPEKTRAFYREKMPEGIDPPDQKTLRILLKECVCKNYRLWLEKRSFSQKPTVRSTITPIEQEQKIMQEPPCLCGSGISYKKCCGSGRILH